MTVGTNGKPTLVGRERLATEINTCVRRKASCQQSTEL